MEVIIVALHALHVNGAAVQCYRHRPAALLGTAGYVGGLDRIALLAAWNRGAGDFLVLFGRVWGF
jgi:hypothetical protein